MAVSPYSLRNLTTGSGSSLGNSDLLACEAACTEIIRGHVADAAFRAVAPGLVEYDIPRSARSVMPALFQDLTSKRSALQIADTSISLATLEEVFLNLSRAELQHDLALDQAAQSAAIAAGQTQFVNFSVPDGAPPGTTLAIPHPQGGDPVHVTVPEGATAGSTIQIEVESRSKPQNLTVTGMANGNRSPQTSASGKSLAGHGAGFGSQFKALALKTRIETPALPDVCLGVIILHCDSSTSAVAFEFVEYRSRLRLRRINDKFAGFHQHLVFKVALVLLIDALVGQKSPLNPHGGDNSEIAWYDLPYATKGECARNRQGRGDV